MSMAHEKEVLQRENLTEVLDDLHTLIVDAHRRGLPAVTVHSNWRSCMGSHPLW